MQIVKILIILITFGVLFTTLSVSQNNSSSLSEPNKRDEKLFIAQVEIKVKTHKNNKLQITIKNNSKGIIVLTDTSVIERDYLVEVVNQKNNQKVELTEQGKRLTSKIAPLTRVIYIKLKPDEEIIEELDLNRLFDLKKSEKYSVVVKREVYFKESEVSINIKATPVKLK